MPGGTTIAHRHIELRGVRVHNLKNINLQIPLGQLVVITGASGSGKSSLAFDTLFSEGQRRYVESFSASARQHLERIERPDADRIAHVPPAIAIRSDSARQDRADRRSTVATVAELLDGLRLLFARLGRIHCPKCGCDVRPQHAADVVRWLMDLPTGIRCQMGFVDRTESALQFTVPHEIRPAEELERASSAWLARGFSRAIWEGETRDLSTKPKWPELAEVWLIADRIVAGKVTAERLMESVTTAMREGYGRCWVMVATDASDTDTAMTVDGREWSVRRFSDRQECSTCQLQFLPLEPRLFSQASFGACPECRGTGCQADDATRETTCPLCEGTRLRSEARAVRLAKSSFAEVCKGTASAVLEFVNSISTNDDGRQSAQIQRICADVIHRLEAVIELGLDYLTLDRATESLSGGELRRLSLAAVIGSRITGTLVVVDEPSAGLSVSEYPLVVSGLRKVQALQNTVIVVDHAPFLVASGDYEIELGPGAGARGGSLMYHGLPRHAPLLPIIDRCLEHVAHPCPTIQLTDVQHRNLQPGTAQQLSPGSTVPWVERTFEFPLLRICLVTGPSGSGKTTLITQVLYPLICKHLGQTCSVFPRGQATLSGHEGLTEVVLIDQAPLAKSSRSNPATWLGVFDEIRQTFATTAEAKIRGFTARHFSFNSSGGGRCRSCLGTGLLKQDMQFLPDVTLTCPECRGTRFRNEILEVKYRGRSIADVLLMSVSEAANFFRSQPRVQQKFQLLKQIGLDYVVLGQPSETLSGGEAQRLKLAARLASPIRGPSLIICDEPTNGLHATDITHLVSVMRELIANGHSLILADNNPDLIHAADHVIELSGSK